MIDYLVVFVVGFLLDFAYTKWMVHTTQSRPLEASFYSMLIGGCSIIGITAVVSNNTAVVPYLLGLGAGTYVGASHSGR